MAILAGCGGDKADTESLDTGTASSSPSTTPTTTTPSASSTTTPTGPPVTYCHVQWPCSLAATSGAPTELVYGWVYEAGLTEGAGQGAGVEAEVGVGPDGSEPGGDGWSWSPASYNIDADGLTPGDLANDEYQGSVNAPGVGAHDVAFRFRLAGGPWLMCDLGGDGCGGEGTDDGYDPASSVPLTVE
jgi:hypothetical protein